MKLYSGKFVLRLPSTLHEFLRQSAGEKGMSLNQICLESLSKYEKGVKHERLNQRLAHIVDTVKMHKLGRAVQGMALFGSTARDRRFADSDIDLLIVLNDRYPLTRAIYHLWDDELSDDEKPVINPHFCRLPKSHVSAGSLWFEIMEEGRVLWDKNKRIDKFIRKLKTLRRQKRIIKQSLHGHKYWLWRESAQS